MKRILLLLSLIGIAKITAAQNVLNATGNVGIGNSAPGTLLQIGGGNGSLHFGGQLGILFKCSTGDRSLMEFHSPDGANRFIIQSLPYGSGLASLDAKPLFIQGAGGQVAIGTDILDPSALLTVKGKISSREIKVIATAGADFVFDPNYDLLSLNEVKKYVLEHKHLPEIPSAKEMINNGLDLGKMNVKLLQKIEELTLYLIEKEQQLKTQEERLLKIEKMLNVKN
jgi:hypothetical protein